MGASFKRFQIEREVTGAFSDQNQTFKIQLSSFKVNVNLLNSNWKLKPEN
jgi:hypothetical protein